MPARRPQPLLGNASRLQMLNENGQVHSESGIASRRKTVFTKPFLARWMPVLVLHSNIFSQDALRFHRTVGSYLDPQAEHPVDLPALLRREVIKRLRRHLDVGFKQSVSVSL
jgi:hypothetical protein